MYVSGDSGDHVPAFDVEAVDTVAAGDAFGGALGVALAEGRDLGGGDPVRLRRRGGGRHSTWRSGRDAVP